MPKVILFNGPPRSGKDEATKSALNTLGGTGAHYRLAGPLKDAVHSLFGMSDVIQEHFTDVKDDPNPDFAGMTPREAYIWMSEKVAKPKFGGYFFAQLAVKTIQARFDNNVVVISDCGFSEEAEELIEAFGTDNVVIVHIERKGATFKKDKRSYITGLDCENYELENNGTLDELHIKVGEIIKEFVHAK